MASRPSQACVQRFNTTARAALGVAALPWATSPNRPETMGTIGVGWSPGDL